MPEEGVCNIALGLGKLVVDGGRTLRFSPRYPQKVLQTSTPELALRDTQNEVLALDLRPEAFRTSTDDAVNIRRLTLREVAPMRQTRFIGFGVGPRERPHLRLADGRGAQGDYLQRHSQIQHLSAGGHRARHPASGRRGDALSGRGGVRRQHGRPLRAAADLQSVADPPDHRQQRQPRARLAPRADRRCAHLCPKRTGRGQHERHLRHRLREARTFRLALDAGDRGASSTRSTRGCAKPVAVTSSSGRGGGGRAIPFWAFRSSGSRSPRRA